MTDKILFVDDDTEILAAFQRQLRKRFHIETALGGREGLKAVMNRGPYAVIVSDLRMPGMDGIQFLSRSREIAPDSVRMMLTGYAELQTAIDAVNQGNIFRFLTKPCPQDLLVDVLAAGIKQYRLVTAERELLEKTLWGSIKVLTEVLGLLNPEAFGLSSRIKRYVREIALHMGVAGVWRLETAAMLSQIGCVILPDETLGKLYRGEELTKEEGHLMDMHPNIASDLLVNIPRMQEVAEIIAYQGKRFDGSGMPPDSRKGEDIPLGARVLKVVLDFDILEASGTPKSEAFLQLKQRLGWYDPSVLAALEAVVGVDEKKYEIRVVKAQGLMENMILAEDVRTSEGILLISKGHEISRPLLQRLNNFARISRIKEPIRVIVPLDRQTKTL